MAIFYVFLFFTTVFVFVFVGKSWIVIPSIIYATHVITTMVPILGYLMLTDFTEHTLGPKTTTELVFLVSIYAIYFFVPLLLMLIMLSKLSRPLGVEKHKIS